MAAMRDLHWVAGEVYWNTRKRMFSVRVEGRVVAHLKSVLVNRATFTVREAGWRKVQETGTKNVHAFIRGQILCGHPAEVCEPDTPINALYSEISTTLRYYQDRGLGYGPHEVCYNPRTFDRPEWRMREGEMYVTEANVVHCDRSLRHGHDSAYIRSWGTVAFHRVAAA